MFNKLILGTVQFGLTYGINNQEGLLETNEVLKILELAKSYKIEILDTASAYGLAENRIGNYHISHMPFKVITKFSKNFTLDWKTSLENSLSKMNLNSVDTAMFHSFQEYKQNKGILPEILSEGKGKLFNRLGVSVYTIDELNQLKADKSINVIQAPFNLLDNEFQKGAILRNLKEDGKEIHTRSCFLQGLFFMNSNKLSGKLNVLKPALNNIREIAMHNSLEIGHLALQYSLNKNYIDRVLIGVDSGAQLKQNMQWALESIDDQIFAEIDNIRVENSELLNPALW
jgi:aryl-alcohol dehydrogenase-like predicted oxidoreductase